MDSERISGTVKKWLPRGYGFLENIQTGEDIFCHISQVSELEDGEERKHLNIGENVTFEIDTDTRTGKLRAVQVVGDGSGTPPDIQEDRGGRFGDGGPRRRGGRGGGFGFRNNNNSRDGGRFSQDDNGGDYRNNNRRGGYSNPYRRDNQNSGGFGGGRQSFGFGGGRSSGGRGGGRGRGVCFQFQKGHCAFGDQCKYLHETS